MLIRIAFLFAVLFSGTAVEAESFICGRWIISEDLSPAGIRKKCAEPDTMTSETVGVRGISDANGRSIKRGGTPTNERWTYRRGAQAPPIVVTIVDGEVKSILRAK